MSKPSKNPAHKSKKAGAKNVVVTKERAAKEAAVTAAPTERDPRLPAPGTTIERVYKKKTYRVEVLDQGFRFDGREWRSLTAIAKEITKAPAISGPRFFGIAKPAAAKGAK